MPEQEKVDKILFVIGSLQLGGAERQIVLLATELAKRGKIVKLFSLEGDGPLRQPLEAAGVTVIDSGYNSQAPFWKKLMLLVGSECRLIWVAATWRPKVLHAFLPLTNFMGASAGRLAGVKHIITSRRALGTHQERHPWWAKLDRLTNRLSTTITANSQAVVEDTIRRDHVDRSKIRLIYNGIELIQQPGLEANRESIRHELGLTPDQLAIVCVANLIPYKGHTELLEALAILDSPSIRLFFAGEDRGIAKALMEQATRLGVDRQVVMLGRRQDIPLLLSAMDIGVLASHEEGFSNALLEKLAAGLPVVATTVGGNPEALDDMPNCYLVKPQSPVELAHALGTTINNIAEAKLAACTRKARTLTRYSVNTMVEQYKTLYEEGEIR
ncbi:glycosyltransferase [Chitinivorax sp. PXF-14]|uniref:glycosyltransferase n=1 Tax=Chitinivorax sp. PXF-14 TaxID=3230488 RepID=UPI00346527BD